MSFIVILLWPLFSPPATTLAATTFAIPFLTNFLYDWLHVSGAISSQPVLPTWIRRIFLSGVPLLLRFAIFAIVISPLFTPLLDSSTQPDLVSRLGLSPPDNSLPVLVLLDLVVTVMIMLGFAGRTAALAGLILVGISQNFTPLTIGQMLLGILLAAVFHLGTGFFSIWRPEDRLITLRAGQRQDRPAPPDPATASQGSLSSSVTLREAS